MSERSITLPDADWQILRAAVYELPIKIGLATMQRLENALAEPVRHNDNVLNPAIPRLVEGGGDHA